MKWIEVLLVVERVMTCAKEFILNVLKKINIT